MQVGLAEIAILSLYMAWLPAVNAAMGQVLSTWRRWTDIPQVVTLITGSKQRGVDCWKRQQNVYNKKPERYAKDNRTAHLTACSDKSVAYT